MLGTERGLEVRLVPERGYRLALIPPVPLPRRPTAELFGLPGRVRAAVAETEIGRAACRERGCRYVYISVVAIQLKKNYRMTTIKSQQATSNENHHNQPTP